MTKCNMPVYVINCKKDIDRRKHIIDLMKKYNIHFDFVAGVVPNKQEMQCMVDKKKCLSVSHRFLTQGEVGCALSHLKIYQKMLDNNISKAIIFEDDVIFDKNNKRIIEELDATIPIDWELVLLGYGGELGNQKICHYFVTKSRNFSPSFTITKPLNIAYSTFAYMITLQGAKKLLAKINLRNPLYQPIDHYTGYHYFTSLYCVKPACVFIKSGSSSGIAEERDIMLKKDTPPSFLSKIKHMNKCTLWLSAFVENFVFFVKSTRMKLIYKIKTLKMYHL